MNTIALYDEAGQSTSYYSMKENSEILLRSELYTTIMRLIGPYEQLTSNRR